MAFTLNNGKFKFLEIRQYRIGPDGFEFCFRNSTSELIDWLSACHHKWDDHACDIISYSNPNDLIEDFHRYLGTAYGDMIGMIIKSAWPGKRCLKINHLTAM